MVCGMYKSRCLTCYVSQNRKQMQFLASEIIHLPFEFAYVFLYLSLLQALLSSFFLSCKTYFYNPRNTTPSFFKKLMSSEKNAFLHAKAAFSYCVPTSLLGNKFCLFILFLI